MIVTEEEARKKLCHKTLGATVIAGEANYYPAPCVASQCMAWQWERQKRVPRSQLLKEADARVVGFIKAERFIDAIKERRSQAGETLRDAKDYCDKLRAEIFPPMPAARRGYCGLAGKVES